MNNYLKHFQNLNLSTKYIFLGLILHLISVYFSVGFYNDDEHFQILEPVAYLLGLNEILINDPSTINWEWRDDTRIRTWLQPHIYYYFINFLKFCGILDPFGWSFMIRLFTSLLGFLSIVYLFFTTKNYFFKKDNHFNYLLFFTFWFYPFIHSRTSAENLSLILFLFAFCFLYKQIQTKEIKFNYALCFLFSILLGISIGVRPNLIFTIFPIFLWVAIFKFNFIRIGIITSGAILALCITLYIDYLHWGFFTNTFWQLYKIQIQRGMMASFGSHPWWYFLPTIAIELAPILSIVFVISLIIFWFKRPKSIYTWLTLGTLIIISCFKHKEVRFAFPIYIFAPLFISYFFEAFNKIKYEKFIKIFIIFSNMVFLILTLFSPANGKVGIYYYLFNQNIKEDKVYYIGENPYQMNNLEPFFYTKFLPAINKIERINHENSNVLDKKNIFHNSWIITNNYSDYKFVLNNKACKKVFSSYPEKIINLNNNWKKLKINWYILYCN